jgi:hypothetical protein
VARNASDALELTLLLADREPEIRARGGSLASRFSQEVPHVDLRESLAVLALLTAISSNRLAAAALAELLKPAAFMRASRRGSCALVAGGVEAWAGGGELALKRVAGAGLATSSPRGEGRVSRRRLAGRPAPTL